MRSARVLFPLGGINRRRGFQSQPPWTTPDCLNVFPDGARSERERGGTRPGTIKAFAQELGSGNKVRLLNCVAYVASGAVRTRIVASSNGVLYREEPAGTLAAVSSSLTLASDRVLASGQYLQQLWIADNSAVVESGNDGVVANDDELTSATIGNWTADADDHVLVIESHDPIDEVQTITMTATGGTFRVYGGDGYATDPLAYNVSTADLKTALETVFGVGNIASVTGTAGSSYVITFDGDYSESDVSEILLYVDELTGGTATIAETTKGASTIANAGTYGIVSVAGPTLTFDRDLPSLTGVVFRIERGMKVYNPSANTLTMWLTENDVAGVRKGSVPAGRTILCIWRGRACLAGGIHEPQSVDFSRSGNLLDFDVSQEDVLAAVSIVPESEGVVSNHITCLIPHNDQCLLVATGATLHVLRGDPAGSGQMDELSSVVGIIDKNAWCKTPEGYVFFLSRDALYWMPAPCGSTPTSISREKMPAELLNIDTDTYAVSMAYDVRYRAIHIWKVHNTTGRTIHYLVDYKLSLHGDQAGADFFPIQLANEDFEPFVCFSHNTLAADESVTFLGCRDGYIRRFDHDANDDDGTVFDSYAWLGPIKLASDSFHEGMCRELTAVLPQATGDVDWSLHVGDDPEEAFNASAAESGEWNAPGRQSPEHVRVRGNCMFIKIANGEDGNRWEMESVDLLIDGQAGRLLL